MWSICMIHLLNYFRSCPPKKRYFQSIYILWLFIIFFIINLEAVAAVPVLRVGILLNCKEVTIKGDKGLKIFALQSGDNLWIQKDSCALKIIAEAQGLKINNQSFKTSQGIKIIPREDSFLQVEGTKYRGDLEIRVQKSLLKVINIIGLEQYLFGVLKKEISPDWPGEALRAQAIAARTFALANMNKYIDQGYNICATVNSQEYGGVSYEHPATNKAVNDTKGIIATYKGEPINAVYHSDCGGSTENSEDVWGGYVPYLRSVSSEYEELVSPPNHKWSCSLSEQEILTKLAQNGHQLNSIQEINIGEQTITGRVKSINILGDNGKKITLKTNDFRLLIGPNLVRSSLFNMESQGGGRLEPEPQKNELPISKPTQENPQEDVTEILKEDRSFTISELIALLNRPKKTPEIKEENNPKVFENNNVPSNLTIIFNGKGSGHGVGLSQWGAYGMAKLGFHYEEILKYYYQGIELTKIY